MNRILVVGAGMVGGEVIAYHQSVGDEVLVLDPGRGFLEQPNYGKLDAIFFCLPSPGAITGHADTSALESRLAEFWEMGYTRIPFIAKTTAPPPVYSKLSEQYSNLVHVPEFLRERHSRADYITPPVILVGCADPNDRNMAIAAMCVMYPAMDFMDYIAKIRVVSNAEAAFYKYLSNAFLATKVTFMNEMQQVASAMGVKWRSLQTLMAFDKRIGDGHTTVPGPDGRRGWGGSCFPKDIRAIIKSAEDVGIDADLLKSVERINKQHRNPYD